MNTTKQHIIFICALALLACYMLTGTASADETNPYMGAPVTLKRHPTAQ